MSKRIWVKMSQRSRINGIRNYISIITETVSISSYMDSPQENQHYIRCDKPDDLKAIISKISEEEWQLMSNKCILWYKKMVYIQKIVLKIF